MGIINRRLFLAKCGMVFSVLPNMLASEQDANICGFPVLADRELAYWDSPPIGWRNFKIVSMEKHKSGSVLRISIHNHKNDKFFYFFSTDNGQTWQQYYDSIVSSYGNLNMSSQLFNVMSNNARTLFWRNSGINEIVVSADEGKSWKPIEMPSNIQNKIMTINMASVSPHDDNRVYVSIRFSSKENDCSIYQVDDRTKTVIKIADGISYMVESRANPNIVIGSTWLEREGKPSFEIVVSKDRGSTWNKVKENIVTRFLYMDNKNRIANTIRKSPDDWERAILQQLTQIESDPVDPDTFYVVTRAGVFVTHNFGESFRILPIAHEYLHSVDEIAVSPVDGRHIFASVKTTDLYHSSDRGCTWKKLTIPTV